MVVGARSVWDGSGVTGRAGRSPLLALLVLAGLLLMGGVAGAGAHCPTAAAPAGAGGLHDHATATVAAAHAVAGVVAGADHAEHLANGTGPVGAGVGCGVLVACCLAVLGTAVLLLARRAAGPGARRPDVVTPAVPRAGPLAPPRPPPLSALGILRH